MDLEDEEVLIYSYGEVLEEEACRVQGHQQEDRDKLRPWLLKFSDILLTSRSSTDLLTSLLRYSVTTSWCFIDFTNCWMLQNIY